MWENRECGSPGEQRVLENREYRRTEGVGGWIIHEVALNWVEPLCTILYGAYEQHEQRLRCMHMHPWG